MIVKVQHFKNNVKCVWEEELYSNVEKVFRFRDVNDDQNLELKIKDQQEFELIPITHIDDNGNHQSLVGAIWIMNDEGEIIERLI